jgi:membrane protein implicated in regulation of membrane protease activity
MPERAQDPTAPAAESPPHNGRGTTSPDDATPADAFRDIGTRLAEMAEYVNYYVSARVDALKATGRKVGVYAALGVVGLLALCTFVVTTMVLLCVGVAQMLTAAFGGRAWAGNLVTAVLFLALLAGGAWYGYRRLTRSAHERTLRKYAQRQQQQRAQFGTDVTRRAQKPTVD